MNQVGDSLDMKTGEAAPGVKIGSGGLLSLHSTGENNLCKGPEAIVECVGGSPRPERGRCVRKVLESGERTT